MTRVPQAFGFEDVEAAVRPRVPPRRRNISAALGIAAVCAAAGSVALSYIGDRKLRRGVTRVSSIQGRRPGVLSGLLFSFGAVLAGALYSRRHSPEKPRVRLWYRGLRKPSYTPPGYVFGMVWTGLYMLMATSCYRVWRAGRSVPRSRALAQWTIRGALNTLWSKLFFGQRALRWSLVELAALVASAVAYLRSAFQVDRWAGILALPYVAWLGFAALLNAEIVRRNPTRA